MLIVIFYGFWAIYFYLSAQLFYNKQKYCPGYDNLIKIVHNGYHRGLIIKQPKAPVKST